jgi:transposase
MIVIGADTHKRTHTLAAVDAGTGRVLAVRTVRADGEGMLDAWRWAHRLDDARVWAIEDCRQVSGRLERCLVAQGERVVRVPPRLMGQSRRGERRPGKSDEIDATAVARAALREGVDSLPTAALDERALEIRLLVDHRTDLVDERTRHQNRLRWHLVELDSELEASLPARALDRERWLERIARRLAALPQTARARVARDELRRIRELTRAERALERELTAAIAALHPRLLAEPGVGAIIAATLIGRTAGAQRFPTDGHYARQAGVAPIPVASGRNDRVRLNRGGDRQLNHALHTIAITRARICPDTRAYLDRKLAQGKTRPEAYRCLKRHLARHVWHLLRDLPDQPQLAWTPWALSVRPLGLAGRRDPSRWRRPRAGCGRPAGCAVGGGSGRCRRRSRGGRRRASRIPRARCSAA